MRFRFLGLLVGMLLGLFGCSRGSHQPEPVEPVENNTSIVHALRESGFEQVAERVLQTQATTVVLQSQSDKSALQPGSSRIGGTPDLPDALPWPQVEGKSLSFVAQINLAEIAAVWPQSPLPSSGTLYFFYDAEQSVWGFDPQDKGKWAVLYSPESTQQLNETSFPDDLPDHARYRAKAVKPVLQDDFPDYFQVDLSDLGLSKAEDERLFDVFQAFADDGATIHKLFGLPNQIQGDMQTEVQLVSHGLYCGDETGYNDPRAEELRAGASQWKLLLQIDTDDDVGMMWGDAGRIYYWIHERDLAARAFENTWLILQCY
jgi:uncharacterized protein YwqG